MIMETQVLYQENSMMREKLNGGRKSDQSSHHIQDTVQMCNSLHARWQEHHRLWFSSSLADVEHKLLRAEEKWKWIRKKSARSRSDTRQPTDVFRNRLAQIQSQSGGAHYDVHRMSSSESSNNTSGNESDSRETTTTEYGYSRERSRSVMPRDNSAVVERQRRARSVDMALSRLSVSAVRRDGVSVHRPGTSRESSVRSHSGHNGPTSDTELSVNRNKNIQKQHHGGSRKKEEFQAQLKELALTSESGNASVLEVIEPSSSDGEEYFNTREAVVVTAEVGRRTKEDQQQMEGEVSKVPSKRHSTASSSQEAISSLDRKRDRPRPENKLKSRVQSLVESFENGEPPSRSGNGLVSREPDLIQGTRASLVSYEQDEDEEMDEEVMEVDHHQIIPTGLENSSIVRMEAVHSGKKRGFLQKFGIKARWPSKRKAKTNKKVQEISAEDFREMYATSQRVKPVLGAENVNLLRGESSSSSQELSSPDDGTTKMVDSNQSSVSSSDISTSQTRKVTPCEKNDLSDVEASKVEVSPEQEAPSSPPSTPSTITLTTKEVKSPKSSQSRFITSVLTKSDTLPRTRMLSPFTKSSPDLKTPTEAMSVTTSEDSGIVARPASSASKSDSLSRPESSASFPSFKSGYPLRKASSVSTNDLLPTPDSSTAGGRLSPAHSEVSKTESAMSPPSDVSKTESTRYLHHLGKIEETSVDGKSQATLLAARRKPIQIKTASIVDISIDPKPTNEEKTSVEISAKVEESQRKQSNKSLKPKKLVERPWYEVSDDESDLLLPERLTCLVSRRSSSGDDDTES